MNETLPITIAIPTYGRDEVLTNTVEHLLSLEIRGSEIVVLDQTNAHRPATDALLRQWSETSLIRWVRLSTPSIPAAMNRGLLEARHDIVLFLDDDIIPCDDLVMAHAEAHTQDSHLVAGRVLQPWDEIVPSATWVQKQFASTEAREVSWFMGGNFSIDKKRAMDLGGFDENFVRVAYNFEREFADRWRAAGLKISFRPGAAIRHLKVPTGGTRTFGRHLTTIFPHHSVGAYYYLLRSRLARHRVRDFFWRPLRAVITRHHLRRPWWIPLTLVSEFVGMVWAVALYARGPRYCGAPGRAGD